ncbi:MAG: hypothetical protein CM15mP80_01530 [Alphaproteobacteria bacterium]|nr:MAG: hypothetical protein CM15mP80_01530 [Alphaproteobacteria bacterium]
MMAISLGVHILKIVINLPITARCFRIGQILRVGRKLARFGRMTGQITNLNKYCTNMNRRIWILPLMKNYRSLLQSALKKAVRQQIIESA